MKAGVSAVTTEACIEPNSKQLTAQSSTREFGIPRLHALVKREQSLKLQAWRVVMVQT
jgi:hypothetical protein